MQKGYSPSVVGKILKEIDASYRVPSWYYSIVQARRDKGIRTVTDFLKGRIEPIAQWSDGKYTCMIFGDWRGPCELYFKVGDPHPVPSGLWMDWPEPHWRLSKAKYRRMPVEARAELECKEQVTRWIPQEFDAAYDEFYHPQKHYHQSMEEAKAATAKRKNAAR